MVMVAGGGVAMNPAPGRGATVVGGNTIGDDDAMPAVGVGNTGGVGRNGVVVVVVVGGSGGVVTVGVADGWNGVVVPARGGGGTVAVGKGPDVAVVVGMRLGGGMKFPPLGGGGVTVEVAGVPVGVGTGANVRTAEGGVYPAVG